MNKKIIRITESDLKTIVKKIINEGWDGKGNLVDNKSVTPNYHKGFSKFPCVTKQNWGVQDLDRDGIIDTITPSLSQMGETKQYFHDGTMKLIAANGKVTKTTYSCNGDKVIDKGAIQTFKTYTQTPFVKVGSMEYIPIQVKDSGTNKWITNLQLALIKKGYLKIPKPTGNYGRWTQNAVLLATQKMNPGQETNQGKGITKDMYNMIVGVK